VDISTGMSLPTSAAGRDDLPVEGGVEDPAQGRVAGALALDGDADPVRVHREGQRGGRGVAGQAPLAGAQLRQVEAPPAARGGHGGGQVAEAAQLGEVLGEVGVGPVEVAGAGPEALQHVDRELGQGRGGDRGGSHGSTVRPGPPTALPSAPTGLPTDIAGAAPLVRRV
jgi:hypothetical protein